MTRLFDKTFWGLTIGLVALFALNFLLEEWMRSIGLQSLSRGCVAIGLLVLWRTGLVSFGHALFFGFAPPVAMLQIIGVNDIILLLIGGCATAGRWRLFSAFSYAVPGNFFRSAEHGVLDSLWRLAKVEALGSTDGIGINQVSFFGFVPSDDSIGRHCLSSQLSSPTSQRSDLIGT